MNEKTKHKNKKLKLCNENDFLNKKNENCACEGLGCLKKSTNNTPCCCTSLCDKHYNKYMFKACCIETCEFFNTKQCILCFNIGNGYLDRSTGKTYCDEHKYIL